MADEVDLDSVLAELRSQIAERTVMITRLLREHCPGQRRHRYVEHEPGSMPWCPHCGYTSLGTLTASHTHVRGHLTERTDHDE